MLELAVVKLEEMPSFVFITPLNKFEIVLIVPNKMFEFAFVKLEEMPSFVFITPLIKFEVVFIVDNNMLEFLSHQQLEISIFLIY